MNGELMPSFQFEFSSCFRTGLNLKSESIRKHEKKHYHNNRIITIYNNKINYVIDISVATRSSLFDILQFLFTPCN